MMGGTGGEVQHEIVIVGGGICGLATALALHSYTGGAIGIMQNGWRALDQLGVASILRQTADPILGSKDIWLDKNEQQDMPFMSSTEVRRLRRSDLINHPLQCFRHQIVSVKLDPQTNYPVLQLQEGKSISAKILLGCDGANSVVADFLQLKTTKTLARCVARGLTNYPNGHPYAQEFVRTRRNNTTVGRIPIDSKLVHWFVSYHSVQTGQ